MEEDEVNETKIERIKRHFKENKKLYIGLAAGVAATIVVMTVKEKQKSLAIINQVNKKGNNIIEVTVKVRRGHPGSLVECDQTGEIYPSISSAAKEIGMHPGNLSKHLHKKAYPDGIKGKTYSLLGDAPAAAVAELAV